uniref:methylmalonyl-CoA mutase family protein n=1 Tax=Paraconexibacter sp. TaxID=2949640 RepID=UPI00356A51BF
ALTDRMEEMAYEYFAKIDELGGMVDAVKQNYPQREIADASFALQCEIEDHKRIVVGVNSYTEGDDGAMPILKVDPALERKQIDRVQGVRARRDSAAVESALVRLKDAAATPDQNLMPLLLDAARVSATEGELVEALQDVFGNYTEAPVF